MSDEARQDEAVRAGRGGLAIMAAKAYFIVTGLVQQFVLPRVIGLADYGALSRVLAVSNVFNNVIVASSTQGVSRTVASAGEAERRAFRATLRIHGVLALVLGVVCALVVPLASAVQHAPEILAPLGVMTGVLVIYGVYAPLVGYLNGRRQFVKQATLDVVAATLRTTFLLAMGWFFVRGAGSLAASAGTSPGVLGATVGAVVAAAGVFLLAFGWTGTGASGADGTPKVGAYLATIAPIMVGQLFTNALMQADIFVLGRYLSLAASSQVAANEWVGVYRACQLFAFLPYQLLFTVTQILFPMLAKARAEDGDARVAELVRRGCRLGAVLCGLLVCVVLALPGSLVKFTYGADVAMRGAATLRWLAVGQAAFAMLGLATTILVSLGKERQAMAITAVALGCVVTANVIGLPRAQFGEAQLLATAQATTVALGLAMTVAILRVRSVAGAFVPLATALRVGACLLGAFALGGAVPILPKLVTPLAALAIVVAYFVVLVLTREIGREDLSLVLLVVRGRGKKKPAA